MDSNGIVVTAGPITGSRGYNLRPQPVSMMESKSSANLLSLGFGYGTSNNNGNVLRETISAPHGSRC